MTKSFIAILLLGLSITSASAAQTAAEPAKQGHFKNGKYYAPRGETMEQCRQRHLDRGAHGMKAIQKACERTTKKK